MNFPKKDKSQISLEKIIISEQENSLKAKQYPFDSPEKQNAIFQRNLALTELVKYLERLLNQNSKFGFFAEIYNLALQDLWLEICQEIERYDPTKGSVLTWVMFKLKYKKIEAYNQLTDKGRLIFLDSNQYEFKQILLERDRLHNSNPLLSQQVIKILKEDPERLFETKLFKKNPQANFKAIALKRLNSTSWADIVEELGVKSSCGAISTFYQRCCRHFAPKFKEYLNLGYK
jgi:hypothetical protein